MQFGRFSLVLVNYNYYYISEFFSPRSEGPSISCKHDYLPDGAGSRCSWGDVSDHCNGLLLVHRGGITYVLNPATRWRAVLPPYPPPPFEMGTRHVQYLVYDPAISPDYEVVSVSRFHYDNQTDFHLHDKFKRKLRPEVEQSEWPPSICILPVFSSTTGQWEERPFARQGEPIGTVAVMRRGPGDQRNAVYWRGALYVHCQTDFVMRLSLSSDKYQVIKPPMGIEVSEFPQIYLGKSAKGVYCASIKGTCRVRVWNLDESGPKMEWVLKHDMDLYKRLLKHKLVYTRPIPPYHDSRKDQGPWIFHDLNYYYYNNKHYKDDDSMEVPLERELECCSEALVGAEKFAWSYDDEGGYDGGYVDILGFHPFDEIIFLNELLTRGLAYHFDSPKVEVLGSIYPAAGYNKELNIDVQLITSSFMYTPCWLGQTAGETSGSIYAS